jgi:ribosomal protein S18 acetylase RimI-like enzyme
MIREAEMKEVNAIAEIIVASWKTAYSGIIDPEYSNSLKQDKFIKIFTDNILNKKEKILVNDDNGVNGFVSGIILENSKYDCEIIGLYIKPEYQRKGIGKKLVKEIIKYFKSKNKKNLIIWTLNNAKNNNFYERIGCRKIEYKNMEIGEKEYEGVGFNILL